MKELELLIPTLFGLEGLCAEELLIQPDRQQCADQGERKL